MKKTGGNEHPGCCDIPATKTLTIGDDAGSLSCTMKRGGIAAIEQASCVYTRKIGPNE